MSEKQEKQRSKSRIPLFNILLISSGLFLLCFTLYINCFSSKNNQAPKFKPEQAYYHYDQIATDDPSLEEYLSILRRDDSASSSTSFSYAPPTPILQQSGVQFALAFGGFVVLNMVAICIHHLYHIATRSTKSYRNIQQDISPF